MSNFELHAAGLQAEESRLAGVYTQLAVSMMQLWLPILNLRLYCFLKGSNLDDKLSQNYDYLKKQRKNVLYLKRTLREILNAVQQGEQCARNVAEQRDFQKDAPFDERGGYGGDQALPQEHSKELADIVRKYYPDMDNRQIENYLKKLNNEGCGYVACINTVFKHFMNREGEFLKTFGFPMYKMNGMLNYEALLTDFYTATDNHLPVNGIDTINPLEDKSVTEVGGTNHEIREYRFEKYMRDHNVNIDVQNYVEVTPENFKAIAKDNDVIVRISPVRLIDQNGKVLYADGGHAMTVLDVTSDGKYVVSSWGEKYFLDPNESYNYFSFQTVEYK